MIWIYAAGALLIYAALVASAAKQPSKATLHGSHVSSHHAPATLSMASAVAGALGAWCILLLAQSPLNSAIGLRELPVTQDDAPPLAGLLDPKDASAVTSYLSTTAAMTPPQTSASSSALPDVETMIERLEKRLETAPKDVKGWKTLSWAYRATGRDDLARAALAKGLSFNPDDQDLKDAAAAGPPEPASKGMPSERSEVSKE